MGLRYKTRIAIIGAGQAGLSAAYHLRKSGWETGRDFIILDEAPQPGGAWQYRWDSLTLSTVNRIHDLPGMSFTDSLADAEAKEVQANVAVPRYFSLYEKTIGIEVFRPMKVLQVLRHDNVFHINTDSASFSALGIINATGTWNMPYIPEYPGAASFLGEQLHTRDYKTAEYFRGKHVVVVGGGISAIQLLDAVSKVTSTTWVTRRPPIFREGPFDDVAGHQAVQMVENRVRQGLAPLSVVSVTGLPLTEAVLRMKERGVLHRLPMFTEITAEGIKWEDESEQKADVILWNTGFKNSLSHLDAVIPREANDGILMDGALATRVSKEPRIHLAGYGPSASTIGANRAGRAAVRELMETLGL